MVLITAMVFICHECHLQNKHTPSSNIYLHSYLCKQLNVITRSFNILDVQMFGFLFNLYNIASSTSQSYQA